MPWEPDHKTFIEDALIREANATNDYEPEPWARALKHLFEAFKDEDTA
jgi:hypothetical protein